MGFEACHKSQEIRPFHRFLSYTVCIAILGPLHATAAVSIQHACRGRPLLRACIYHANGMDRFAAALRATSMGAEPTLRSLATSQSGCCDAVGTG